ncbi:MAG: OmpA family protein [Nitrospirae bacterium]|nr:OmpA family protein [Nitrospirota bacterium]
MDDISRRHVSRWVVLVLSLALGSGLLTGCEGMNRTQKGALTGTAVGAGVGALLGKGGGHAGRGALIGGAIGALSGGLIGNYMDRQAQELEKVADTTRTADGIIVTMKDKILFDVDSAALRPAATASLDKLAAVLTKYPKTTITVAGHTDNTGRPDYNQKLSERRANAVKFALVDRGVGANRVTAMGFGADNPVAPNTTPDGRTENRRVELHIVPNDELKQEAAGQDG